MIESGTRVGHYLVTELLGTGGMGSVHAAMDERLGRQVALKAIRRERRVDGETRARLLREARILSQLDHPNVCRIYELLQTPDDDYLVLELIRGKSLGKALREDAAGGAKQAPDARRRLEIAIQVASALVAAHGRGVIHRDLKPDNVLLTEDGVAKVLDFGIARSLDEDLPSTLAAGLPEEGDEADDPAALLRTRKGNILGTAGYMSPEQARGEPTTAASDMYSFGLLLQELFTNEPPFEAGTSLPLMVAQAAIGHTKPLPAGMDPDVAALVRRLQSLEPAARPSAGDALERLQWIAGAPGRRRRRQLLTAAIAVLVLLTTATSFLAWRVSREAARANQEARRASEEAAAARQVSDFLVGVFAVADPGETTGNKVTARELLDRGAQRVRDELQSQPLAQARMMDSMGQAYQQLGLYEQAGSLLSSALELRRRHLPADDPEVIESINHHAYLLRIQGQLAPAGALFAEAVSRGERALAPFDPRLAFSLNGLGIVRWNEGSFAEAESLYRRALDIRQRAPGVDPRDLASSLDNLAILLKDTGRGQAAEPLYKEALTLREARLGPNHPHVARSLNNLGELYREEERYADAEPLYRRALTIWESVLGPTHPSVAGTLVNLASTEVALGRLDQAEASLVRALGIVEKAFGPDHEWAGHALRGLGEVEIARHRPLVAEAYFRRTLAVWEKALGADHPLVGEACESLAQALAESGRGSEAIALQERAIAMLASARPSDEHLVELRQELAAMRR